MQNDLQLHVPATQSVMPVMMAEMQAKIPRMMARRVTNDPSQDLYYSPMMPAAIASKIFAIQLNIAPMVLVV